MDINNQESTTPHYYGNQVRYLFMIAGLVMFVGLPSFTKLLDLPPIYSTIGILVLGISAGVTNPKQIWTAILNAIVAIVGFVVFNSYTITAYQNYLTINNKFFIANLFLGFVFLFAIYFSIKTLRGLMLNRN